jgi:hypothetical protein
VSRLPKPAFLANRKTWFSPTLDAPGVNPNYANDERYEVKDYDAANLVSSSVTNPYEFTTPGAPTAHLPVLDLDLEAHLEPSTTPGHYHLYLNKGVSWAQYCKLLDVMAECGLLEEGFVRLSKERGATFVRKPGHKKIK